MATETEIKVEVQGDELERIRQQLEGLSHEVSPRSEELNVLYDQAERLKKKGCILRLRSYGGHSVLTFKGPLDETSVFKQRPEFQTVVDGDQMREILAGLSFEPSFRYDKYREIRRWGLEGGEVEVCFDETPVGYFIEIEGDPSILDAAAQRLGWPRDDYIKKSYIEIYRERLGSDGLRD